MFIKRTNKITRMFVISKFTEMPKFLTPLKLNDLD